MSTRRVLVDERGCVAAYFEGVLDDDAQRALYETLESLPWRVEMDQYGKQGRPTFYAGDEDAVFSFCGLRLQPNAWPPAVLAARRAVAAACSVDEAWRAAWKSQ